MDLNHLHFAYPLWLWGGVAIPLMWLLFFLFYQGHRPLHQLEKFIDKHLLPYLVVNHSRKKNSFWRTLLLWSIVWSCLTLALAGPRWTFREMETFSRDQSLVILLDLSESMNATDIKPSRLIRAKQKVEDFINLSKGVKIGFLAFAADPHMMSPITDDKETIRHLLPSLGTDLIYVQGSRLSSALDMALTMLEAEPGHNKALLVISDGGFEDPSAITTAKKVAEKGIVIHAMGIGTDVGAPLQDHEGNIIKKNGSSIISKLEKEMLSEVSKVGNGRYLEAHYSDHGEDIILKELDKRAEAQMEIGKKNKFWDERFYLLILPVLPVILWWFRRGALFAMFLILFTPVFGVEAMTQNYFKNSEELGKQALDDGDYETASQIFRDPYRKGVAYYRAGHFAEAEKMFQQSSRPDIASNAAYNLGNAFVQQQKLKEAITAYEDVLKRWPDHTKAKENLELVKKMLEQQKQTSNSENSDQQNKHEQDHHSSEKEKKGESQDRQNQNESEKEDKRQSQNEDRSDEGQTQENERQQDSEDHEREQKEWEGMEKSQKEDRDQEREARTSKSQEEQDADLWLNRIVNDPKKFLKNKFYIESKKNGTKGGIDPW